MELTSGNIKVRYAHMESAPNVEIPELESARDGSKPTVKLVGTKKIRKGDIIGYVGTRGNSSGNHLHIEIRVDNIRVEPTDVFPDLKP